MTQTDEQKREPIRNDERRRCVHYVLSGQSAMERLSPAILGYEARLQAAEAENARLREALERCDLAIQAFWKSKTALGPEDTRVVEAGRLANELLNERTENG